MALWEEIDYLWWRPRMHLRVLRTYEPVLGVVAVGGRFQQERENEEPDRGGLGWAPMVMMEFTAPNELDLQLLHFPPPATRVPCEMNRIAGKGLTIFSLQCSRHCFAYPTYASVRLSSSQRSPAERSTCGIWLGAALCFLSLLRGM